MRARTAILSTVLAALCECKAWDSVPSTAVTDCNAQIVPGGAATDVLFVVDDSNSMREEQDELAANLGTFIDQLLASPVKLDIHLGVTNTSVEDYNATPGTKYVRVGFPGVPGTPYPQGTLVAIAQVEPSGVGTAGQFLWGTAYDDPSPVTSVFGGPRILSSAALSGAELARDFKANVLQGVWGASREQPLSAMKRALEKAAVGGTNLGFLRAGARLAVVILTDEDDCSGPKDPTNVGDDVACHGLPLDSGLLDSLDGFVDYLDTTVGNEPVVALIAGFDANNAVSLCRGSAFGTTTSAFSVPNRLNELMNRLEGTHPGRTIKASICRSFGPTLLGIASQIIPQTMPLQQSPEDYRMMAVAIERSGSTIPCPMEPFGSPNAANAGVIYNPAPPGGLPSLTFQDAAAGGPQCRLGLGDRVDLRIVCAR